MTAMQEKLRKLARQQPPGCRRFRGKRYTGASTPEMKASTTRSQARMKARERARVA